MKNKTIVLVIVVVAVIAIVVVALLVSMNKSKVLHAYDSENLTGLKTVSFDKDKMTIEFDKEYAFSDKIGYGSIQAFFDEEDDSKRWIYIMLDQEMITIHGEHIKSSKKSGTISFPFNNIDPERVTGIRFFCYLSDTTISFRSGELTCVFVKNGVSFSGGDISYYTYSQTYDESKHSWSEYTENIQTTHVWT